MLKQYHPFSLHRPAHLTRTGRPEGVLKIGDITRHKSRLWMIVGFKLRQVQSATRTQMRDGSTGCKWQTRYYAHGMYEVVIQELGKKTQTTVSDIQMLADYRNDITHHPRANNRRMRRHILQKQEQAPTNQSDRMDGLKITA